MYCLCEHFQVHQDLVFVMKLAATRWLNKSLCIAGSNLRSQFRLHSLTRDIAHSLNSSTRDITGFLDSSARDVPNSLTRNSSLAERIAVERISTDSFLGEDVFHLGHHQQAGSAEKNLHHSASDNNRLRENWEKPQRRGDTLLICQKQITN